MKMARGCGWATLFLMFLLVACLVFVALAAGLFRTGELPLYAPRLTGLQPDPNSAFRPSTPITLTFDQPMNTTSVEGALVLDPDVSGAFQWNQDRSQVTFVPEGEGFEPGTTYSVRLEAGAEAGTLPRTTSRSVQWSFSLPPLLDALEPPTGAEALGPQPVLTAAFNYPLDCTATFRTFSITPDAVGLLGCKDSTLTFDPAAPLEPDTNYVATLAHVFLEGDPTPRPGLEWTFGTAPALVVEAVSPDDEGLLEDLWSSFTVTFNRPVEAGSAVSRLGLAIVGGGIPVEGEVSWQQDGAVLVFQPEEPLEPGVRYDLVVDSGVQDLLGYELAEAQRWSYETPPMLDLPSPVSGSRDVALDGTIQVPFARPMDRESVEAGVVVSPALEAETVWEGETLILIPRGGFSPETEYQVLLEADVRDASGAPLAQSRQWTFETEPFLVEARVPSATVVTELGQPAQFTFALPMDRASVRAALTISPTTPGDLIWSDQDRTVAFVPDPAWLSGTEYQVTLAGTAQTADRLQTLGDEIGYTFTTGVADIRFGEGPGVQVLPAGGERGLQVLARGADVADFRLFAITVEQFLELFSSDLGGAAEPGPELLAATPITPTASWRETWSPLAVQAAGEWQPAEVRIPTEVLPGLYLLSAEPRSDVEGSLLLVLTDHVLVVKRAPAGPEGTAGEPFVAWDTAIRDGSPVVSATLRLYDRDGAVVAEAVTGGDGLSRLSVPVDADPVLAVSESEGEVTVVGLDAEWSEGHGILAEAPEGRPAYLIYAFTDQAVYGPAGTVHFKQFVRADDDAQYTLPPPDLLVTVRLRDPQDEIAASQVLTVTEFGTAYGSFVLAGEPESGAWSLETEVDGTVTRTPLWVEEPQSVETEGESGLPLEGDAGEAGDQAPGAEQEGEEGPDLAPGQASAGSQGPQGLILLDRQAFVPGQAAQITITTPVSGTALVSLERGTVRQIETVALVSGTTSLSLPVRADYGPNVDVVVSQFGPPDGEAEGQETQPGLALRTARAPLLVPMASKRLTVALEVDQESYGPGDDVVLQVRVTDYQDEPVAAELSLALVDGASHALPDGSAPGAFEQFHGPRPNAVMTYDSMRPTRWLVPGEPRPAAQPAEGEGQEEAAPPGAVLDTAYWAPALVTDDQGRVEVTLQAPDVLTTWMVVARAITTDTQVGEATAQLVVTQELSIQPEVPEVLVAGDVFFLTAQVHNLTSQPVSATVQLEQDGLALWAEASQPLHLPAGGTAMALWPAVAERVGETQLTLRATASRGTRLVGRDVVEIPLRIDPLAVVEPATWAGALTADNPAQTISLTVPSSPTVPLSPLEIHMASSAIPVLAEGLAYLLEGPYGCVEPVAGQVVAGAIAADAREVLTASLAVGEAELLPIVERALQDLYGSQHDEGGWSWCGGDSSDAYLTAYVLGGLARAREAGFAVDATVLSRGAEALQLLVPGAEPGMQAFGAYALVLAGYPVTQTLAVTDVLQLDAFSQAALALAIGAAAEADLALEPVGDLGPALLESLEASAIEDASTAYWDQGESPAETALAGMGSPVRTTALVAQALARLDPENDLLPKALRWLMEQRQRRGWGDTQRTSYAVLALAASLGSLEPETATPGFQVRVNGALWQEGQLDRLQGQQVITVPVAALVPGENELQLTLGTEGAVPDGVLYYAVTATSLVTPAEGLLVAAEGRAPTIGVRREYRLPGREEPTTEFEPGDLVEVEISLDVPEESRYVVIEDRLPAGFEGVGEGRQAASDVDGLPEEVALSEGTLVPDRMDVGAGRATFFFEQLPAGPQSFVYLARAATWGSFAALPVTVYPMYDPEAWSRSASARCSVRQR